MTPIPHTIEYRTVPLSELHPHPDNPRRGDVAAIGRSLDSHGQYRPIVVNRRTMEVLAGNHTLRAASKLGWERSEATFLDVDEQRAKRILLVDNRTNDLAGYDTQELADLLEWVGDLGNRL